MNLRFGSFDLDTHSPFVLPITDGDGRSVTDPEVFDDVDPVFLEPFQRRGDVGHGEPQVSEPQGGRSVAGRVVTGFLLLGPMDVVELQQTQSVLEVRGSVEAELG